MTVTGWERMSGDHFSLMAIPEPRVSAAPWPGSWTAGGRGQGSDGNRGVQEKIVLWFVKADFIQGDRHNRRREHCSGDMP